MPELIDEFKKEHEAIKELLQRIKRQGVHTMEGRNALMENKKQLCKHLKKQVDELYPELKINANSDPDLKKILGTFEEEMIEISAFCTEFFSKYEAGGGGIDFFKDFERLKSTLESRMEEENLSNK